MLDIVFRTVFTYFVLLLIIRMMGKREISQLSPFDFVVAIMIADLAVIPLQSSVIALWHGIVPMVILALMEVMLSFAALHSYRLRKILDGNAQIVIKNGCLLKSELRKARYNLDDLLAQLRESGYPNVEDIEVGVLETSGKLSVIPKSQKRPVTPEDLKVPTGYEGLPTILIMDGIVLKQELAGIGVDMGWLEDKLAESGVPARKVFLATLNTQGKFNIVECDK
ncbi:MAG: membrane protein [Peptococcaceae bacterium BRH_c4b]|nr:MAG: membrane protein [Peptococcaceae bacterium BRH_c4b]